MRSVYQQLTSLPVAEKKKTEFILRANLFLPWTHMKPHTTHGSHVTGLEGKREPETLGLEVKKKYAFRVRKCQDLVRVMGEFKLLISGVAKILVKKY